MQPAHPVLGELLDSGPQLGLMQIEIIHRADTRDIPAGKARADAVHERAARGTEVVGHGVTRGDGVRLAISLQVVAASQMFQVRVGDDEVGCEHGCGNFAAIRAVADECID